MNLPLAFLRRRWWCAVLLASMITGLGGCSKKPAWPAPDKYFSDYVGSLTPKQRVLLNNACSGFEISTSIQFLVAYDKALPPNESLTDYCHRVAASWKLGQKGKDNGVVLFVFAQSKQAYIDVGRGVQGTLTPAACDGIVHDKILPKLDFGALSLFAGGATILGGGKFSSGGSSCGGASGSW